MFRNSTTRVSPIRLVLTGMAAALLVACAEAPTAPTLAGFAMNEMAEEALPVPQPTDEASPVDAPDSLRLVPRRWPINEDVTVSAVIGPEGGEIEVSETHFALEIPDGALSAPTTITVVAKAGDYEVYEFDPHGTEFAVPVVLRFATRSHEEAHALVEAAQGLYLSDDGAGTVLETFTLRQEGFHVRFETSHFSRYALAFRMGYVLAW
ncbi:MAG: hypothetical protein OEO23_02270 [Gemmatimonadota bacterium]|nr:hypothetical protein [Gemmatimonadota bacterium]